MTRATRRELERAPDEVLVSRAASGDRDAAGAYLARHLRLLAGMARRLNMNVLDPDDLLSEAVSRLLENWARGSGPTDHVNAYLITSMRNRVTDELRSPRSRTDTIDPELELAANPDRGLHEAELATEFAWVRAAMARLPDSQRLVLQATVVDGRKPAELETVLGRPASSIYSLSRRAKLGLRRAVLQVALEASCRRHGRAASALVPEAPPLQAADLPGDDALRATVVECRRCDTAWRRWAGLASLLGFGSVLVVSSTLAAPAAPAQAAQAPHPGRPSVRRALERLGSAPRGARLALAGGGAAAVASGVVLVVAGAAAAPAPIPTSGPDAPAVMLNVTVAGSADTTSITTDFDVRAPSWHFDSLELRLASGVRLLEAPSGWRCTGTAEVRCSPTSESSRLDGFRLAGSAGAPAQAWRLEVSAMSEGVDVTATASSGA